MTGEDALNAEARRLLHAAGLSDDDRPGRELVARDVSYEIELDEPPAPGVSSDVNVDISGRQVGRRPIVPPALRKGNRAPAARKTAGRAGHAVAYHGSRSVWYVALAAAWSLVGVVKLAVKQLRWMWLLEQHDLRQRAASANDPKEWVALHKEAKATRKWRGIVLAGEVLALTGVVVAALRLAPPWASAVALVAAVALLAHLGHPPDRPIVRPATVTPRFRKLTADIVLRAYYAAGLGHEEKTGQQITFGSTMSRDGEGSRVLVDLPYGKGLDDAVAAKGRIASGLDVTTSQVFIHRDATSHRRHVLWVADRDPLAVPVGRSPLLRCAQTDIWRPAPFGLDERGQPVAVPLMWNSILVGAQPRQGKTFSARALALYAALDPHVRLTVFDGKGSPDWRKFTLVADRCGFGLAMTRDGDPVEAFLDALRELKNDVQARYERLSGLPVDVCPEGKLTREIARDGRYDMPVRLVVVDEFQEYFDLADQSKEIAQLLVFLVKVAPGAGVIVVGSTQRPSGIGAGQVAQSFMGFRDNFQIRFSLRTGSWQVSDLVLGAGAYSEGYDSSTLLPEYKGVGILRGVSDLTPTVRTFLADGQDAEKILVAARAHRERAGTLTGVAAGETVARVVVDVLADTADVFRPGEAGLWWSTVAARLAERLPETYADATADTVSAQLRAVGVPSVDVKHAGQVRKGCRHVDVRAATG